MSSYRIGQPIKDSVADVIRERQALLKSRRNGYITDYYSSNAISLFNEKTPWVRLSSTVDIEDFSKAEYFGVSMGDQLAKRNVLQGTGEADGGFDEYIRDGERIPGTFDRQELGLRPKPGITDVSTTSHGMFGALRTTEVTILCWTPFDLDIIDSLYMRPGYSLLLEMGHSHYHDKELRVQNDIIPVDFFEDYGQGNSQKLLDDLEKKREEYRGSYEAIYGVIKNFSWSLRTDGGYECKVKLVSKGEVLESLITTGLTDKVSIDKSSNSTTLNSVVDAIDSYVDNLRDNTYSEWLLLPQDQYNAIVDKEDQDKYTQLRTVYSFRVLADSSKDNSFSTCITLGLFNAIVNRLLIKEAIRDEQTDGVTYVNYTRIHTELDSNLFKTVSGHYSMNPRVCLLPKGGVTVGSAKFKLTSNDGLPKDVSPNGVNGILITTDLIRAAITNSLDQEENTVNILSVYRYIFSSIENATGNINNFNLHLDENTNTWHIVDRLFLNKQDSPVELSIFGLDSFAKGVMLQSMLSPKVSSLLAISANVNQTPNSVLDSTAFSTLNRGLKDRIIPQREFPQVNNPEEKVEEASRKKLIESKKLLEDYITSVYFNTQGSLRKYNIKDNISNVQSIYRDELNKAIQEQPNNGISFAIPFELTLTLDGIGGLVIGESFTVSADLLPLSYKRLLEFEYKNGIGETESGYRVDTENSQVGFLITGLNQKVTETGWDTIVRCQMYVLHSNDVPDIPVIIDAITETPELNIPEPEAGSTSSEQAPEWPYYSDSDSVPDFVWDPSTASGPSVRRVNLNNYIKNEYLPALDSVQGYSKGLRLLATVMTYREGFYPKSRSYRTNNPGNVGNTDIGENNTLDTLQKGVEAQMRYLTRVLKGLHTAYPLNRDKDIKPYYSPEIAANSKTYGLTPYLPGYKFTPYKGTLEQFIKIYSTGARGGNGYLSDIISYFKANGYDVDEKTTIEEIDRIA